MQEPHNPRNHGNRVHLNVGTFIVSRNGILCTMTSEVLAPTTDLRRVNYGHEMLKEGLHDL